MTTPFDPQAAHIGQSSLQALQSLIANSNYFQGKSARLTIIISKVSGGHTYVLGQLDTGFASPLGEGGSRYEVNNIAVTPEFWSGSLMANTVRAWTEAAAHLRDPNIVATGTLQVEEFSGQYYNYSFVVKENDNAIGIEKLEGWAPQS